MILLDVFNKKHNNNNVKEQGGDSCFENAQVILFKVKSYDPPFCYQFLILPVFLRIRILNSSCILTFFQRGRRRSFTVMCCQYTAFQKSANISIWPKQKTMILIFKCLCPPTSIFCQSPLCLVTQSGENRNLPQKLRKCHQYKAQEPVKRQSGSDCGFQFFCRLQTPRHCILKNEQG